jgi:hypothetical protein
VALKPPPAAEVRPPGVKPGEFPGARPLRGEPPPRPTAGARGPRLEAPGAGPFGRPAGPVVPPLFRPLPGGPADPLAEQAGALEQIHARGGKKDWAGLHQLIEAELKVPGLPAELRQGLQALRTRVEALELLAGCEAALRQAGAGLPAGLDELPAALQKDFRGLRALGDLEAALGKPWRGPPDLAALRRDLAAVQAATDEQLALHARLHLSLKAQAEGHTAAARGLLPSAPELASAGPELRDLKAVAVRTTPGAGAGQPGRPVPAAVLPPEAPAEGVRPGVKESLRADLPVLKKEMASAGTRVRARAGEGLRQHGAAYAAGLGPSLDTVLRYARKGREQERQRVRRQEEQAEGVARLLGRKLTDPELILTRVMGQHGKTPAEMAAILAKLPPVAPKP